MDNNLVLFDSQFAKLQEALREISEKRRREETPKQYTKRKKIGTDRETGEDLYADTPTREYAQRWLDERFPGWSIIEVKHDVLTISRTDDGGRTISYPGMFTCYVLLQVAEQNGIIRRVPGTGAAPVSLKEISRDNTQLLQYKPIVAYTNAIKNAISWLGFAFDLRVDEEQIDRMSQPPSPDDENRLEALLSKVGNDKTKEILREKFRMQNAVTVHEFLDNLESKIKEKLKGNSQNGGQPNGATGTAGTAG
jgi:hypothetical protein